MAEVDTSSYLKSSLPVSPLDIAAKIGGLQQQKLSIDQAKLDQANQGLTYMTRAMGALGPDASKEDYIKAAGTAVKLGLVPEAALKTFEERAIAAKSSRDFYNEFMTTAADHQQQINYHIGQNKSVSDNKNVIQGVERPASRGGGFDPATKMAIQIPPGTPGYDSSNQQVFEQPAGPSGVAPAAPVAPSALSAPLTQRKPLSSLTTGPTGPTVDQTPQTPTTLANRLEPLKAGPSPLFPEGKEAYTKAQLAASARAQSIKPAIDALKLMPGLATGPGTEQFNTAIAALKAWGLTDIKADSDPTVMRQEINKKLAQYVGNNPNVSRSDAGQALAEAGSPSAKVQILPALMSLTRDAIALDRVQILKPQAFKGTDYQNYIKHEGNFPQSIDQKALSLDLLPENDRNKLITKMATQYKNGNASEKKIASKFLDTLKLAKEHGIYEGM